MNFRTNPRIKEAIQRAAALSGVDDSVFTMNAAYQSALETSPPKNGPYCKGWITPPFFAALDAAPAATDELRAAFESQAETIANSWPVS